MTGRRKLYLIGICGTGMGALAGLMKETGWEVRGSDKQFYPPVSDLLVSRGIPTDLQFEKEPLQAFNPDCIVIGNAISRGNPQAEWALTSGIKVRSFPEALREFFLAGKEPAVVMGTHGKTTTCSLLAHVLMEAGLDPGFMIGGIVQRTRSNFHVGNGSDFVVEGDEYDTAFFDKQPKFMHYAPKRAILTSIEFDHADVYDSIDTIIEAFAKGIALVPREGVLVYSAEDDRIPSILNRAHCRTRSYGVSAGEWRAEEIAPTASGARFTAHHPELLPKGSAIDLALSGRHNVMNALSVIALLMDRGVSIDTIAAGLKSFQGVKRRQEVIYDRSGIVVIDDFAHHPTAVRATIDAVRSRYPRHELWAVFEPRTNTSRTNRFFEEYATAFADAPHVRLTEVYNKDQVKSEPLNVRGIVDRLIGQGVDAVVMPSVERLVADLSERVSAPAVILIMSNGAFGGIYKLLCDSLNKKSASA